MSQLLSLDCQTCHSVVSTGIAGGVLQTVLQGNGGIMVIGERGLEISVWKIDRNFFDFFKICGPPRLCMFTSGSIVAISGFVIDHHKS